MDSVQINTDQFSTEPNTKQWDRIDTLVFAGGGIRGIAQLGALLAVQDLYEMDWSRLTTFAGTSVGALIALMFTCGFSLQDMQNFVQSIDTQTILNDLNLTNSNLMGLHDSFFLRNLVHAVLKKKGFPIDITFGALFQKTQKTMVVAVTDLSSVSIQYLSHENFSSGPVDDVVVGSMSLPLIFKPVQYKTFLWVDGGLCDIFPIHLFKPENTLGFQVQQFIDNQMSLNTTIGYQSRLVSTVALTQERILHEACERDKYTILQIDVGPIQAMQPLKPDEVASMILKAQRDIMNQRKVHFQPLRELPPDAQKMYRLPEFVAKTFQKPSNS